MVNAHGGVQCKSCTQFTRQLFAVERMVQGRCLPSVLATNLVNKSVATMHCLYKGVCIEASVFLSNKVPFFAGFWTQNLGCVFAPGVDLYPKHYSTVQ